MCSKCDYWYALNYVLYPLVGLFLKLFSWLSKRLWHVLLGREYASFTAALILL